MDIGGQARQRTQPAPSPVMQPPGAAARPAAAPREAEIITELKEDMGPPSPMSRRPEWAARPAPAPASRMRAASAPPPPPRPAAAPEAPREVQARPAASAPRVRAVEPCQGQSGFGQSICLARQCSDAAWRNHRQCAQVRDAEQKLRERYEQGG